MELILGSPPVVSKPNDVLVNRMAGEFFKLIQLYLKHLRAGEGLIAIERVGEALINVLAVSRKNDMARFLRKILKKLENVL